MGRVTVNPSRLKAPGPSLSLSGKRPMKVAAQVADLVSSVGMCSAGWDTAAITGTRE